MKNNKEFKPITLTKRDMENYLGGINRCAESAKDELCRKQEEAYRRMINQLMDNK